ncbi:3,4-dihydroxy-2-butanone 4-phosphate synthase [Corchorus olitorius]|uniref:3,4-dihydroxy-2-butanone 4-phosphate synthase n=1 Tax=Corchorus olitorius TaxID=93759 RepID=A0A1R3HDV4_9ROSI|nr:3,4-dihydroxy-2-butanone 4-phosphate synthase [Corchorus olitorius]
MVTNQDAKKNDMSQKDSSSAKSHQLKISEGSNRLDRLNRQPEALAVQAMGPNVRNLHGPLT